MSITKYKAFTKIAELGSLTKAAKVLGYSQPGISHMISSLENEFGFSLIFRNHDSCSITENGKTVLPYCRQIVKNHEDLLSSVQALNGIMAGSIKVCATNNMMIDFVPKAVSKFSSTYSGVKVDLHEGSYEDIMMGLKNGTYDIGFHAALMPNNFEFIHLFNDPICLIIPPGHMLEAYDKVPLHLLDGCDFIMPIKSYADSYKIIKNIENLNVNVKYEAASDLACFGLVENNLGISVISKEVSKYMFCNVVVKEFVEDIHRDMGLSVNSIKHSTPAVKTFIKIICNSLSET